MKDRDRASDAPELSIVSPRLCVWSNDITNTTDADKRDEMGNGRWKMSVSRDMSIGAAEEDE